MICCCSVSGGCLNTFLSFIFCHKSHKKGFRIIKLGNLKTGWSPFFCQNIASHLIPFSIWFLKCLFFKYMYLLTQNLLVIIFIIFTFFPIKDLSGITTLVTMLKRWELSSLMGLVNASIVVINALMFLCSFDKTAGVLS